MTSAGKQENPKNNEVVKNTPKLYFGKNNTATQKLEPEKMSPAGQQKNPNIDEVGENTPKLNFGRNNTANQV